MPPNGRGTWCARAIPSRQRCAAPRPVTSALRKETVPAFGCCAPARTLSSVVLPAPLGPTMPTASSGPSAKCTSWRTTSAPKRLPTPIADRIGVLSADSTIRLRVRLELALDGDVGIGRVLAVHPVELVRPVRGLAPLAARDRRRHDVRHRALAPAQVAERRLHRERLHRRGDLLLVLRIARLAPDRLRDVEEREARAELLARLLLRLLRVAVADLLRADAGERRLVRPRRVPVPR